MLAAEFLKKLRQIELRTRKIINTTFVGEYRSTFKGTGMEFVDVREYLPGDDIRTIDWNVTARAGRPFVKKFVEERELTVFFLVDGSGSTHFGTRLQPMSELAAEVSAVLAFSAADFTGHFTDSYPNVPMQKVTLTLNGANVNAAFVADADARTFRGVLHDLVVGDNLFVADANGLGKGRPWASLTITNHPRGGPVLLGAQTTPWVCATPTPVAESGSTPASNASGLTTTAVDAQCNIATEYKLFYRTTTAGCSSGLPDPSPPAPPPANNCFKPYTADSTPARSRGATGRECCAASLQAKSL